MSFPTKEWHNRGSGLTPTPYDASGINDLEKRIADAFKSIIEIGSNENGSYIKYENGTLICYINKTVGMRFSEDMGAGLYRAKVNNPFVFPVQFVETPVVIVQPCSTTDTLFCFIVKVIRDSAKVSSIELLRTDTSNGDVPFSLIAIGKWK